MVSRACWRERSSSSRRGHGHFSNVRREVGLPWQVQGQAEATRRGSLDTDFELRFTCHAHAGRTRKWQGVVIPLEHTFAAYLRIKMRSDGSAGVFLKNPERNAGLNEIARAIRGRRETARAEDGRVATNRRR